MDLRQESWFTANPWKARLLTLLVCCLLVEGVTRLCVVAGLLPYHRYPTSRFKVWGLVDPVVGRWRFSDATFREVSPCYDVAYTTNSEGARDRERSRRTTAARRVVVLGDSFLEGMGVEREERVTELLEQDSGVEHLNFGTAGFGTIQEWLLYESRVLAYDHSDVLLFVLPKNDFIDNAPAVSGREPAHMYRPLLKPLNDGYEIYYPMRLEDARVERQDRRRIVKNAIDNNVYLLNVLRGVARIVRFGWSEKHDADSDYDSYSEEDMQVMLYALGRVKDLAGERPLWIVSIPSARDFLFARTQAYEFDFVARMRAFADRRDGVEFMDLLPTFMRHAREHGNDFGDYTHRCERHWNPLGHRVAAEAVRPFLFADRGGNVTAGEPTLARVGIAGMIPVPTD